VFRRSLALPALALVASLTVVLGACSSAPAAPALTDPKDILTKAAVSAKDVKTFEFTGAFTGSVNAPQLGNFDLSSVKLSGAIDVANKKARISVDAPTLLGTKIDALVVDQVAYYKVAGPLAVSLHASAEKYTKMPVPSNGTDPVSEATDVAKLTTKIQAELDKLPSAPVKQADEKCGDQDCYHVSVKLTADQLKALDPTSSVGGDISVDVWTLKSNYRPAKFAVSAATVEMGTFGFTMDLKYDVSVSIDAPPADQVVTP
jgi:hypothetical protein